MGLYDYISGISVLIYVFIYLIMLNSQKTKMRNIFLGLIMISIMWSGGSLLMRTEAFPSYQFWYHVSLAGILFMPIMYFRFIMEYINNVKRSIVSFYALMMSVILIVNIFTGLVIPPPAIVEINGAATFVYDTFKWPGYILYGLAGVAVVHMLYYFYTGISSDPKLKRMSRPITIGILSMFLGHILLIFPWFSGFPIDILSGSINAFALVFALARRSPFKLKMLMSENVGYVICFFLAFLSLLILNPIISSTLMEMTTNTNVWSILYIGVFTFFLVGYFILWKQVVVGIFVKEEEEKSELLNNFSATITQKLDTGHIFKETLQIIEKVVGKHDVYIALKTANGSYKLSYSNQPLADLSTVFRKDNPLIKRLGKKEMITLDEFKYDIAYQTMWEREKFDLIRMDITHAFGIVDDEGISGVVLISDTNSKKRINHHFSLRLQSICTMVSIALKNSASYERAVIEARTDDLTGLYNRKYFYQLIEKQFNLHLHDSLGLVLVNLDDFKMYNQLFGVKKADQALETIATIIKGSVGDDGFVARFSGKEFTIILPRFDVYRTLQLLDKIRTQIESYAQGKSRLLEKNITTSVGVCVYPFGASTKNELIENVQQAVYQVKRNGKNAVKVFDTYVQQELQLEKPSYSSIYNEYKSTIYALTAAIDAKDSYTFSHSDNVANYAVAFATELGLNNDIIENVRQGGLLHDIGKISIPEHILNKPGRLTDDEFRVMQGHVDASIEIIRHLDSLEYVIPGVLGHHERWDGTGYPRRVRGEDIPLTARILCIVDSFDAMVSGRVYKNPRTIENALKVILEEAGKQFDPNLAVTFVELVKSGQIMVEQPKVVNGTSIDNFKEATTIN